MINPFEEVVTIECSLSKDQSGNQHICYFDVIDKNKLIKDSNYDYIDEYTQHNRTQVDQIFQNKLPCKIRVINDNGDTNIYDDCIITDVYEIPIPYDYGDDKGIETEVAIKFSGTFNPNKFDL